MGSVALVFVAGASLTGFPRPAEAAMPWYSLDPGGSPYFALTSYEGRAHFAIR